METMKVDQKSKSPEVPRKQTDQDGVPVYELRFCVQGGRDLGFDATGGQSIIRARDGIEIAYLPQRRYYRITQHGRDRKTRTVYVPETWASWEPLE